MELKELYQEIILDHGKNPRNKGKCDGYTNDAKAHNPLCGDKVHIFLKLNKEKEIEDLSFEGEGCAISLASASILTETVKGKPPVINLNGIDKQLIGQIAAKLKSLRPVEPYKGKGVKFVGEYVRRKVGKTAAA